MIDNPMLNLSYEQPEPFYEIGWQRPAAVSREGRRPSESLIPIAVTPISRTLLQRWSDPWRENRVLFCQREADPTRLSTVPLPADQSVFRYR